jgi:hypothetical protein
MKKILLVTSLLAFVPFSSAQQQSPCAATEYRQFDFWLGAWNVFEYKDGKPGAPQGQSRVATIFDGCSVQEEFLDAQGGVIGKSLNAYYPQTRSWHQFYVDKFGQVILLAGTREADTMTLSGEYPSVRTAGLIIKQRITWTRLSNNEVRQRWVMSTDNWQTSRELFDGLYIRKNP